MKSRLRIAIPRFRDMHLGSPYAHQNRKLWPAKWGLRSVCGAEIQRRIRSSWVNRAGSYCEDCVSTTYKPTSRFVMLRREGPGSDITHAVSWRRGCHVPASRRKDESRTMAMRLASAGGV